MVLFSTAKPDVHGSTQGVHHHTFTEKGDVADLRDDEIAELCDEDLIEAIFAAHLPCLNEQYQNRLKFYDHQMLQRLVYLARQCCRNQGY